MTYGQAENSHVVHAEKLLPIGLAEGSRPKRNIAGDEVISYADVDVPEGRLCDRLRSQQERSIHCREVVISKGCTDAKEWRIALCP